MFLNLLHIRLTISIKAKVKVHIILGVLCVKHQLQGTVLISPLKMV